MATANAANLPGTVRLERGGGYTGIADSKLWSGVHWIQPSDLTGNGALIHGTSSGRVYRILILSNGRVELLQHNVTSGNDLLARSTAGDVVVDSWQCVMWSVDMADTGKRQIYVGDTSLSVVWTTYTDIALDHTKNEHTVGSEFGTLNPWDGDLSIQWVSFGQYVDFSQESNRRIFFSPNGKVPQALADSTDGNVGGLGQPILFLNKAGTDYKDNLGSGGGLTVGAGTLGTATGPEIDSSIPILRRRREFVGVS